jgi:hypothetical protein
MSKNTLLINYQIMINRTELHTNVDEKLVTPTIKRVQDMYLMPLLGTALFSKLQDLIDEYPSPNSMPSSDYKDLLDDYIIDCMTNYVMAELTLKLNYQFWNKGVATKNAQDSTNSNPSELNSVRLSYQKSGDYYAERMRRYLIRYSKDRYPEYFQSISGIDQQMPQQNTFDCPIYLKNNYSDIVQPSDNLPDNRFD